MAKKPNHSPQKVQKGNSHYINRGDRGDSDRTEYGMVVTSIPRFSKRYYLIKQKVL